MTKLEDVHILTEGQTVVGVFRSEVSARDAMGMLEAAGMPPDRVGIVIGNVRQAREVAGSYSPQGAVVGALCGAALLAGYVVFGGQDAFAAVIAGLPIIGGLAFIGGLAGRARVFKREEYGELEDDVAKGEILVSVVCDTPEGADVTRAILERARAVDIRLERSGEGV